MNGQRLYDANSVCMLIVCSILAGAFYFQFVLQEDPCPLCLLQRMGMLGVTLGLGLNTYFGFRKQHFAMVIMAAVIGCGFSVRQVLLHIAPKPGDPLGYGSPFWGMHLYTWGVLIFVASILGAAVFLLVTEEEQGGGRRLPSRFESLAFSVAFLICGANVVTTLLMCGVGACCENGPCP